MPAHHVPNVFLRQVIVAQVQRFKAMLFQMQGDLAALPWATGGHADKHMGLSGVADAVIELGDRAR